MSKKDNFSQAMFEMFGLGKAPETPDDDADDVEQLKKLEETSWPEPSSSGIDRHETYSHEPIDMPSTPPVPPAPPEPEPEPDFPSFSSFPDLAGQDAYSFNQRQSFTPETPSTFSPPPFTQSPAAPAPAAPPYSAPAPAPAPAPASAEDDFFKSFSHSAPVKRPNCTYFAEGTSFEGTLRSDSDVEIAGEFKGEIASDGRVTLHSNTTSSIAAAELVLLDCNLIGDAMVSGDVSINENSSVTGNIRSSNIVSSGIIKGNLNIQGNITLTESAQVFGDIKTGTLAMSRGAKVSGRIDMNNN